MTAEDPGPVSDPVSVLLAHHHALVREGIAAILRQAGLHVVGQADNAESLRELAALLDPDVVLLDWEIPEVDAGLVKDLVKAARGAIAILTRPQPPETFLAAMQAGAGSYLSLNLSPEDFIAAVFMLAKGDFIVSREMAVDLREELASEDSQDPKDELSARELEVLGLISQGATNREIAVKLTLSENTVKVHLRHIMEKLNLRNRQQAAAYAVREGLEPAREVETPTEPAESSC